jgi:hypothetical protein
LRNRRNPPLIFLGLTYAWAMTDRIMFNTTSKWLMRRLPMKAVGIAFGFWLAIHCRFNRLKVWLL